MNESGGLVLPAGVTPGVGTRGQLPLAFDGGDPAAGAGNRVPLIGLVGKKRVGKDALAAELVEKYGYTRAAFADAVKDLALAIDPNVRHGEYGVDHLSDIVDVDGWDGAKRHESIRRLLQNIGVGVRNIIHEDAWIAIALRKIDAIPGPVVVTDVRFQNEAETIWGLGGILVRIDRPAVADGDSHVSETELDGIDADISLMNDGISLDEFLSSAGLVHSFAENYGRVVAK